MTRNELDLLLQDPLVLLSLAAAVVLLVIVLLVVTLVRAGRTARASDALTHELLRLGGDVQRLGAGQSQLAGNLQMVSDTQATAQLTVIQTVETRLNDVQQRMADRLAENATRSNRALAEMQERMRETLHGTSEKTTNSLTQLRERLQVIDRAQDNITKLSGDVLSLQDILSNKQRRGMFGEIQLTDIVSKALPADSYTLQTTLSNGKRADCLVHLPNPPGPIVIDAKFPFESFEQLAAAETKEQMTLALRALGQAVKKHIRDISEKYILEGETADGAIMFLPSEAIYAELHARLPEVVREGFAARVWIVSPTTCMATLNTMRAILKDSRMREQAGAIRRELALLHADTERLVTRVGNLDRHFSQARKDVDDILISGEKAGKRAQRLHSFDFAEDGEAAPRLPVTDG
ncbi:DNA recombination protein RmuC [Maribius pontilimi]|uniref:DNA recombination protein RmuC homolog n=1 Tax=Palleronia pontilimi TaxID=1964209 RepID=A0A934IKA2_9RHOB|nr:DNA recombination protein RmuC [Palleronia pontilimi]MBJ3764120.1 DNA recombination protein RmuC [Palleronia pontilimi]